MAIVTRLLFAMLVPFAIGASAALAQDTVAPTAQMPLRAAPPGTFFTGKGKKIGEVLPTEQYRVLERRSVPTIMGVEQWIRVQKTTDPSKQGWVYSGKQDSPHSSFRPLP